MFFFNQCQDVALWECSNLEKCYSMGSLAVIQCLSIYGSVHILHSSFLLNILGPGQMAFKYVSWCQILLLFQSQTSDLAMSSNKQSFHSPCAGVFVIHEFLNLGFAAHAVWERNCWQSVTLPMLCLMVEDSPLTSNKAKQPRRPWFFNDLIILYIYGILFSQYSISV